MSNPFVQTDHLTKRYGAFTALHDCTLAIRRGEIYGLLGPNGAGKTTLIRMLLGFLKPTSGHARIDGLDCYRQSVQVHRRVAYLPGEARLFPQMRARDVMAFFAELREDGDWRRSLWLAERLNLDIKRRVAFMSTGMRQKLALVVTLAAKSELLVLDEPTANLDPNVRGEVMALVKEAQAEGHTILFSSHILSEVEEACDRVAVVRAGELVHTQMMAELRRQHRVRARLTGPLPPIPEDISKELSACHTEEEQLTIEAPGELSSILGWLSSLPIEEVTIEPFGLRSVYDRYHADDVG